VVLNQDKITTMATTICIHLLWKDLERNDREDQYGSAPLQQRGDVTVSGAFNDVSRIITSNNG
jgi:hypothetical protein